MRLLMTLQPWRDRVADFSEREKWMLVLTGLVLVVGVIDVFLVQPLRDQRAIAEQQIASLALQQTNFTQQLEELTIQISNDPAMMTSREIEGLDKAIADKEQQLRAFTDTLVSPAEMSSMLQDILEQQKRLKLIELANQPVSPLLADDSPQTGKAELGLYRHPIRLIFEGTYADTLSYLLALEKMPNKFYWNRFDYQVLEHPRARVTLSIYTLSTNQWWIGESAP